MFLNENIKMSGGASLGFENTETKKRIGNETLL